MLEPLNFESISLHLTPNIGPTHEEKEERWTEIWPLYDYK